MNLTYYYYLKENMTDQIQVFEDVLEINLLFRKSIINRDWGSVNKYIKVLNELSIEVNKFDQKRIELLIEIAKELHSKDNENFYSLIKKAPEDIKDSLINIFYTLKSSIIQVQGVFKGLNSFVEHKKEVSKEIIEVLVNDAKGNVYSKPGRRDQIGQGFLVNRQL